MKRDVLSVAMSVALVTAYSPAAFADSQLNFKIYSPGASTSAKAVPAPESNLPAQAPQKSDDDVITASDNKVIQPDNPPAASAPATADSGMSAPILQSESPATDASAVQPASSVFDTTQPPSATAQTATANPSPPAASSAAAPSLTAETATAAPSPPADSSAAASPETTSAATPATASEVSTPAPQAAEATPAQVVTPAEPVAPVTTAIPATPSGGTEANAAVDPSASAAVDPGRSVQAAGNQPIAPAIKEASAASDAVDPAAAADPGKGNADGKQIASKALQGYVRVVPTGTKIPIIMDTAVDSDTSQEGDEFEARTAEDLSIDGNVVVPAGSVIKGRIATIGAPKALLRNGSVALKFDTVTTPDNRQLPLTANLVARGGVVHAKRGMKDIAIDAGVFTLPTVAGLAIGAVAGNSSSKIGVGGGALIGAGVGAAVGLAVLLARKGKRIEVRPGDELKIELAEDLRMPTM